MFGVFPTAVHGNRYLGGVDSVISAARTQSSGDLSYMLGQLICEPVAGGDERDTPVFLIEMLQLGDPESSQRIHIINQSVKSHPSVVQPRGQRDNTVPMAAPNAVAS
jgi:hypothetical protein